MKVLRMLALGIALAAGAAAQPSVELAPAECLPAGSHGVLEATAAGVPEGGAVRLYLRRLDEVAEDFYWVEAGPRGGGRWVAVLPRPARAVLPERAEGEGATPWAAWWRAKDGSESRNPTGDLDPEAIAERASEGMLEFRDWLDETDDAALQAWLEGLEAAPVEAFAAVVDLHGERLAQSAMRAVEVRGECEQDLGPAESGRAQNLALGETAPWQAGERPYRFDCEGVVTRIDPLGVPRADGLCRIGYVADLEAEEEAAARALGEPAAQLGYDVVEVFYGTDRSRSGEAEPAAFYGGGRGRLELGTCRVSIPADHQPGVLEEQGLFEKADPRKHVLLLRIDPRSREVFVEKLRGKVAAGARSALVFVHGYNVSFEDAARRTAQMAADLGFPGAPVMYSWPSQGELQGYTTDEANVRWTVPHLAEFLDLVSRESGAETVHLVAHSMGNRAVTEVLRRLATESAAAGRRFNQVVLVAPDVDADVFRDDIAPRIRGVGERVTLYASKRDKALLASKGLHGHPRAGDLSDGVVIAAGVETVDASEVDTSMLRLIRLGHSYFADKPSVLADLQQLLAGRAAVERGLEALTAPGGGAYWRFEP